MSDVGIDYDASTAPSPVGVTVRLQFSGTTLSAILESVDTFIITLTPSGNIAETIISAVGWPIAQTLGIALPPLAKGLIEGHSFPIMTIAPQEVAVEGVEVTLTPANLTASNFGGSLKVSGTLALS